MPGRTSKTSKKDARAGILQSPTNRTANVSTGNNDSRRDSTIPLQERRGNFTGPQPFVRVSTAGSSPKGPFTETLMGLSPCTKAGT